MKYALLPVAALVVVADEWIKKIALAKAPLIETVADPGLFAFAIHKNWGIAFNIPFKLPIIILISIAIGAVLAQVAWGERAKRPAVSLFALLIMIGACGNLYDRLVYGFTVDYLVFFGRTAINLSDLVILTGVFGLLHASRKRHAHVDKSEISS